MQQFEFKYKSGVWILKLHLTPKEPSLEGLVDLGRIHSQAHVALPMNTGCFWKQASVLSLSSLLWQHGHLILRRVTPENPEPFLPDCLVPGLLPQAMSPAALSGRCPEKSPCLVVLFCVDCLPTYAPSPLPTKGGDVELLGLGVGWWDIMGKKLAFVCIVNFVIVSVLWVCFPYNGRIYKEGGQNSAICSIYKTKIK